MVIRSDNPQFSVKQRSLGPGAAEVLRVRLARALGRFGRDVVAVHAVVSDVNAERGGIDRVCRVRIRIRGGRQSLLVEYREADTLNAIDGTVVRVRRAVTEALDSRRELSRVRARDAGA